MSLGFAKSEAEGLKLAHEYMRFGALGWEVLTELPGVKALEEATKFVKPEDLKGDIPHGPAVDPYVENAKKWLKAGFDHIVLLAIGPDQEAFIRFFKESLGPRLRDL